MSHRDELCAILEQALAANDTAYWHERLTEAGVPAAPVADVADVANAPQTEALGMIQHLDHPTIPDLRLTALPLSFDGERALYPSAPPAVGEHTAEILARAGLRARRDRGPRRRRSDPAMSHVSASFSATIRVRLADAPGSFARLASAIGEAGGSLGAIDLVRVEKGIKVRDVTVDAADADHLERIVESVRASRRRRGRARLRPHVPDAPRRQDRDAVEGAGEDPRRPLDGVHARRGADLPGDRRRPRARPGT